MLSSKAVKIIGLIATVVGFGATALGNWANEKTMEEQIEKKVNEALAEKENKEES